VRVKLFYKFFGIISLSIILSLATAGIIIGYFGEKNFHNFLEKKKLNELKLMSENLGKYYKEDGGFVSLKNGDIPLSFAMISGDANLSDGFKLKAFERRPPEPTRRHPDEVKLLPPPEMGHLFSLYDANSEHIAGGKNKYEDMNLVPVVIDGEEVGHFGILKRNKFRDQFATNFLERQLSLVVVTILMVMGFALLMAVWLTKYMLAPIKSLRVATQKISDREFDFEMNITSKDELGDLARNFVEMASTLKAYEQKQSRWISDISHELRTPLSVILGSIEAVQDGVRKPNEETVNAMHSNALRMKRLVNELHDISLAESGGMHLQKVRVDIAKELCGMLDFYEVRFSEFNIILKFNDDKQDKPINVDLMRMNQVFINLLENTIKYAKSPGELFIDSYIEGDIAVISFQDTGPGVPEEHISHLFERLYRVDNSRNRATGGSGLGLSICKHIIESHGGLISAQCGDKGGLQIIIRLPLEKGDE